MIRLLLTVFIILFSFSSDSGMLSQRQQGIFNSCDRLDLPCEVERGRVKIKSVGISIGPLVDGKRNRAVDHDQEMDFREKLFEEFWHRHSAPIKGLDDLEDDPQLFSYVAVGVNPVEPESNAYELLKKYAMTDYGAKMIAQIMQDSDEALLKDFIDKDGVLSELGKQAILDASWEGHFIVGKNFGQPTAGRNTLLLPENIPFRSRKLFPVGDEKVDFFAIVHHEFGHTRFSRVPLVDDHIHLEADVVNGYENPVRYLNTHFYRTGYFDPRTTYYDGINTINTVTDEVYQGAVSFVHYGYNHFRAVPYRKEVNASGDEVIERSSSGRGYRDYRTPPKLVPSTSSNP